MATSYNIIIDSAYDKLKEYDFLEMSEEESDEILRSYIRQACVSYFYHRHRKLDRDDSNQEFIEDLDDVNIEILANYVIIHYLDANYIRSTLVMKPYLSGTDFHAYVNKDVLAKVVELRDMYKKEIDQLTIDYSYNSDKCPLWKLNQRRNMRRSR